MMHITYHKAQWCTSHTTKPAGKTQLDATLRFSTKHFIALPSKSKPLDVYPSPDVNCCLRPRYLYKLWFVASHCWLPQWRHQQISPAPRSPTRESPTKESPIRNQWHTCPHFQNHCLQICTPQSLIVHFLHSIQQKTAAISLWLCSTCQLRKLAKDHCR